MNPPKPPDSVLVHINPTRGYISRSADIYDVSMPTVAAGCGHILNIDFFLLQICQGSDRTKGGARKDKHPSDDDDEEEGEQGEETIPKQGKASSVAEALADTQAEMEGQSAITSSGKERGKESVDSAKPQSDGALNAVIK